MLCLVGKLVEGFMNSDDQLEQQILSFLKYLKIPPQNNYFTCYSYAHPFLNSLPFDALL